MKKLSLSLLASSLLVSTSALATAIPTDLSPWIQEGNGKWVLSADKNSVTHTINHAIAIIHNNQNSQGTKLSGNVKVNTNGDDDFFGFVLGYQAGDVKSNSTDYILIDWKQASQVYNGKQSYRGLSASRVTGSLFTPNAAWTHTNTVQELQRAKTLGDTGWKNYTNYHFDITFTASLIEVFIDGNKELSLNGSFNDGAFGFYNYSQPNVSYSSISEEKLPEVPVPAAAWLFGSALAGLAFKKRR